MKKKKAIAPATAIPVKHRKIVPGMIMNVISYADSVPAGES